MTRSATWWAPPAGDALFGGSSDWQASPCASGRSRLRGVARAPGSPSPFAPLPQAERASAFCNVRRTMDVLGVSFEHDLSAFDEEGAEGGEIARL